MTYVVTFCWNVHVHVYELCRQVANLTRFLDPTRPITFADKEPYDEDLCVSMHLTEHILSLSLSLSLGSHVCIDVCTCVKHEYVHAYWNHRMRSCLTPCSSNHWTLFRAG